MNLDPVAGAGSAARYTGLNNMSSFRSLLYGLGWSISVAVSCGRVATSEEFADAESSAGAGGAADALSSGGVDVTSASGATDQSGASTSAEAGSLSDQAGRSGASAAPIDIHGRIMFGKVGAAGAVVGVNGVPFTADDDGYFFVPNVTPPYQLIGTNPEQPAALVFEGITTPDPILNLGAVRGAHTAKLMEQVYGGGSTAKTNTQCVYDSLALVNGLSSTASGSVSLDGTCELDLNWNGPTTDNGHVSVLQWAYSSEAIEYSGYGGDAVTVGPMDVTFAQLSTNQPAVNSIFNAGFTFPDGYVQTATTLDIGPFSVPVPWNPNPVAINVPSIGLSVGIDVRAVKDGAFTAASEYDNYENIVLFPAPEQVSPPPGAADLGPDATFEWSNTPDHAVVCARWAIAGWLIVRCAASPATHSSLPNLSIFGVNYPPGMSGTWNVFATGPVADANAGLEMQDAASRGLQLDQRYQRTVDWPFSVR